MRLGLVAVCGACVLLLAGCSGGAFNELNPTAVTTSTGSTAGGGSTAGVMLKGSVFGGQAPISGAHVYLFAAGTGGYGGAGIAASSSNASVSLLSAAATGQSDSLGAYVLTSGSGTFTITGDYTCTAGQQVYVYSLGGNPGSGANAGAGLMAALGSCPAAGNFLATTPFISVNEVTTVAAAWAMAGFATDATHVSSLGTALAKAGIANAFSNAANLANVATGAALATTTAGNGTVPQSEIYTLADILAACVNSSGAVTGPTNATPCYTLFTNALSAGLTGTQPTDTATAAINIAHNPAVNVNPLYTLGVPNPPFPGGLTQSPSDYSIALSFTGGGINGPSSLAIDGSGNVWTVNSNNSISKINGVTGAAISPSAGWTGNGLALPSVPFSIAIDSSGNAWVVNAYYCNIFGGPCTATSSVSEFTSAGGVAGNSPFSGGGLSIPDNQQSSRDIAFDASGNAWIGNSGNASVTKLNGSTGAAISGTSGYSVSTMYGGQSGIAVDTAGNVWLSGFTASTLYELSVSTGALEGTSATGVGGMQEPYSIAIDSSNNVWVPNYYDSNTYTGDSVSKLSSLTAGSVYYAGGLGDPSGIVVDGAGNAWVASGIKVNGGANAGLAELSNSGSGISPPPGYQSSNLNLGGDVGVDGSGNVWVTNIDNASGLAGNNVVEFVGLGVPVVTPLATAVKNGTLGTRP